MLGRDLVQDLEESSAVDRYVAFLWIRTDLGDPDLPFVAGQLEQDPAAPARPLNDVLIQLPTMVSNSAVATTEGLTTLDGTHFDSASQRQLGLRYADALLTLTQE